MKTDFAHFNLLVAWLWILLGFLSGMVMGMFFRDEKWLGGYASYKRRMYRLGHISFFGLGAVNLMFYLTVRNFPMSAAMAHPASWALIIGALTMPLCCLVMAHVPKAHLIFAVPVISLIVGGILVLGGIESGGAGTATTLPIDPQTAIAATK